MSPRCSFAVFVFLLSAGALAGEARVATMAPVASSLRGPSGPTVRQLEGGLLALLRAADDAEAGSSFAERLGKIEVSLSMSYQSLPKNEFGRLAPRSVHYLVHSYFMKEHGWLIKGLEPHGFRLNVSEGQSAQVLRDHVPAVLKELLESRHAHRGLSLGDVVAMVVLLERLVLDQSVELLHTAFEFMNMSAADVLDEESLHSVLTSYLILVRTPSMEVEEHNSWVQEWRSNALDPKSYVAKAVQFEQDLVNNTAFEQRYRNPFVKTHYSFEAAARLADRLMHRYGQFQNEECHSMKGALMKLDHTGQGLVPLSRFYLSGEEFGFWESTEYLSEVGALDVSTPGSPRVRIANYVMGPSNCIANSQYYSVCCLDECKAIQNELEGAVKSPVSTPDRLMRLVSNVASPTVEAPRELSTELQAKLRAIAAHHGGQVPLHGRLFTQWLHFAFPNECPYPHTPKQSNATQVDYWGSDGHLVSAAEFKKHIGAAKDLAVASGAVAVPPSLAQWTDDEVLPLFEAPVTQSSALAALGRGAAAVGLLVVVFRIARSTWSSAMSAGSGGAKNWKAGAATLPMHS